MFELTSSDDQIVRHNHASKATAQNKEKTGREGDAAAPCAPMHGDRGRCGEVAARSGCDCGETQAKQMLRRTEGEEQNRGSKTGTVEQKTGLKKTKPEGLLPMFFLAPLAMASSLPPVQHSEPTSVRLEKFELRKKEIGWGH